MDWWIVVFSLGNCAFMGWMIQIFAHYRISKSRERSEERLRLLERFSSSRELAEFLESPAGARLLASLSARAPDLRNRMANTFSAGLVLLFIGLGFLFLVYIEDFGHPDPFLIPGVLCSFAGLAVLLSLPVSVFWLKEGRSRDQDSGS